MPRVCSICSHDRRREIDRALLSGDALRVIASKFSVSRPALDRHKRGGHVATKVVRAAEGKALLESESLAEQINTLRRRTDVLFTDACELLQKSKKSGETKQALQAINAARSCISESRELTRVLAELAGQLPTPGVSLTVLAPLLIEALAVCPVEVRVDVAQRLQALDRSLEIDAGDALNGPANR